MAQQELHERGAEPASAPRRQHRSLDRDSSHPLYRRVAGAIIADIRRGRLTAGCRLPSSRKLATSLGLHRNTVLSAYEELLAQGWIVTTRGKGTFVADGFFEAHVAGLPSSNVARSRRAKLGYRLQDPITTGRFGHQSKGLRLGGGIPDVRLIPADALSRGYRRAARARGAQLFDYGEPHGLARLRSALAKMLAAKRGIVADEECILVTRGSQMALYLIARVLTRAGDSVAVEELGYRPAWEALRLGGGQILPVPVDGEGVDTERLRAIAANRSIRAVYVTPHHQYPTTPTMSAARRWELLELAREKAFFIIEDDYDHEFHYLGRPVLPLASHDEHNSTIYVGTLSKVLAPGIRLGFVVAPPSLIEQLTRYRSCIDYHGDHVVEAAVADLIEDGELQRHMNRTRRIYKGRRDCLVDGLQTKLGDALAFELPPGGMAIWATVNLTGSVDAWAKRAERFGVTFSPASRFTFDGSKRQHARFGFAPVNEPEIRRAVSILAQTAPRR